MSDFGSQAWRPKSAAGDASPKVDPVEVEERSAGYWKKMFFRTVAGQDMNKWRKEMRDVSPYTGLPRLTEWVLRYDSPVGVRKKNHICFTIYFFIFLFLMPESI